MRYNVTANFTHVHCHTMNIDINSLYFSPLIHPTTWGYSFISRYSRVKKKNVVFTPEKFNEIPGERIQVTKFSGASSSTEVLYPLKEVFMREHFDTSKDYTKRVQYPFNIAKKLGLRVSVVETPEDLAPIKELHDKWVVKKLENVNTHRITFSSKRYYNCVINSLDHPNRFIFIIRDKDDSVVSVRVVCRSGDCLFDAAFFVEFWKMSQISEACNVTYLKEFQSMFHDVNWFNLGLSEGSLKKYKMHYPNNVLKVWRKTISEQECSPSLLDFNE